MCGIVALFSRNGPVSEAALKRATQSLHHRGPDGQRHWISADRRVAMGHTRLSIIDLATGDQPIASENQCIHIAVNGEFYGYEAIQQELERSGHRLRTRERANAYPGSSQETVVDKDALAGEPLPLHRGRERSLGDKRA